MLLISIHQEIKDSPPYVCLWKRLCTCDFQDVPAVPESTADISDESDGFGEEERRGPNANMATGGPVVARLEDKKLKTKPESNNSSSSSPSCTARISCPYGKQCYRYVYLRQPQSRRGSINGRSWFLVEESTWKASDEVSQVFLLSFLHLLKEEPSSLPGVQSPGRRRLQGGGAWRRGTTRMPLRQRLLQEESSSQEGIQTLNTTRWAASVAGRHTCSKHFI